MSETPQEYIARLLANVGSRDPWDVLATTAGRLRELTHGKPADRLTRKPAPDRWSVAEIIAHLADAEVVGAWRFRSVLALDGTPLQAYDQNRWAEAFHYDRVPVSESLDAFEASRRATLSLLKRVDPALYEHYGLHAERGQESITHLIRLYAGHDLNHLAQVERLLA
jgi:hypothetical protein